ncbi:MAG TPA: response regulator [Bacteroidia bacterium]|jgi:DNA-binding NarL/FixJ family response regulator|nr:response regulator [Bacteroidia bacterium]
MDKKNKVGIFIVDDNKVFSLALKSEIEVAFKDVCRIEVQAFETGEACMKKFKEEKPQIAILDYHLNSKNVNAADGIQVLDMIKKANKDTNVIILTSDDNIDIALKSFHHAASDYVVKTETKFKKINYSLFNLIKVSEARDEAKTYKSVSLVLSVLIALVIGAVIAITIIKPSLLK